MISSVYAEEPGCNVSAQERGRGRACSWLLLIVYEGKSLEKLPNTDNLGMVKREQSPSKHSQHGTGREAGFLPGGAGWQEGVRGTHGIWGLLNSYEKKPAGTHEG